jgi:hypothetical protein
MSMFRAQTGHTHPRTDKGQSFGWMHARVMVVRISWLDACRLDYGCVDCTVLALDRPAEFSNLARECCVAKRLVDRRPQKLHLPGIPPELRHFGVGRLLGTPACAVLPCVFPERLHAQALLVLFYGPAQLQGRGLCIEEDVLDGGLARRLRVRRRLQTTTRTSAP